MKAYCEEKETVLKSLDVTVENGLTSAEATKRLEQNGKNKLAEGKKKSLIRRFMEQLADPMTIILIVAAAISGALAIIEKEFPTDVIIILAVVLINDITFIIEVIGYATRLPKLSAVFT